MTTEWLLIGGPANGKKVTIKHGKNVMWHDDYGREWLYQGCNYFHCGQMFRIGIIEASIDSGNVAQMINEAGLRPVDDQDL